MRKRVLNFQGEAHDAELHEIFGPRGRGFNLYHGLWAIAEDSGVLESDHKSIAKQMGLFNFSKKEVDKYIAALIKHKKIIEFVAENLKKYYWLVNFHRHQPLNYPALPSLPTPLWVKVEHIKTPNRKRTYAKFTVDISVLPVNIVSSARHQRASADLDLDLDLDKRQRLKSGGPDNGNGSGAFGAPSLVKDSGAPTEEQMREIAQLCDRIMLHFGIPPTYNPIVNEESWRKKFHPLRFVQTTISQEVPVEVTLKVLHSMDRQKEDIQNPYAWLVTVMGNEWSQYNYELEIKAHEERKKGLRDVAGLLRRII